jgi:hypothetical protein
MVLLVVVVFYGCQSLVMHPQQVVLLIIESMELFLMVVTLVHLLPHPHQLQQDFHLHHQGGEDVDHAIPVVTLVSVSETQEVIVCGIHHCVVEVLHFVQSSFKPDHPVCM